MSEQDKNYKLTLYLDTPKMLLKPGFDKIYDKPNSKMPYSTWFTGHTFIGLTDDKGKEEKWGYYPDPGTPFMKHVSGTLGHLYEDDNSHYNEAVVYMVSKDQYDAAKAKVDETRRAPGFYQLFKKNCSSVANDVLKAAGVEAPSNFVGLTPHRLTLSKRAMRVQRHVEVAMWKAKNTLKPLFGQKKAPTVDLMKKLKDKPIAVSAKEGTKSSIDKKPLDVNKVLSTLISGKRAK